MTIFSAVSIGHLVRFTVIYQSTTLLTMKFLAVFAAALISSTSALQANWYELHLTFIVGPLANLIRERNRYTDNNCGNFEDATFFSGFNCQGNFQGASSALFATSDGCASMFTSRFSIGP